MSDVTVATIEEMEPVGAEGFVRRARATLGVTAWGMQVLTLPAEWDGYPEHNHADASEPEQEEVYVTLSGSATLIAGDDEFALEPGTMARVGPEQLRRILPGPAGVRLLALGGTPGSFAPSEWTELGAAVPTTA